MRTGRRDRPIIQLPSIALRSAIIAGLAVVLLGTIFFRLWYLQVLTGTQYVAQANDNRLRTVKVVAPRGVILDRSGKVVLVDNRPGLSVGVRLMDVPGGDLPALVRRLATVLDMRPRSIARRLRDERGRPYDLVIVKEDVGRRVISYILERKRVFPGVEVQKSYLRDYPQGDLAAHLLGHIGEISPAELKESRYRRYAAGDVIGKDGVENTYDRWLRGRDGFVKIEVDALGRPKPGALGGRLPAVGNNLVLSLDVGVQRAAENALRYGIGLAHANQMWAANAGAAVVLDPTNGEVLALASYPSFDPKLWVGGMSRREFARLRRDPATPLLNRTDQGLYPVGSTFKAIDAVAGLEEGVITPSTSFYCPGSYTPPNVGGEATWNCWSPGGHGHLSLVSALEASCDVYFYNVGYAFYGRKGTELADWAKRLGLGHLTGIDIPGEAAGVVPTPDWLRETFTDPIDKIWKPGNSINLAIGQGYLLATPLQMAVAYAAIANGGYVVKPHLGVKMIDAHGRQVQRFQPRPRRLDISAENLGVVRRGLLLAANGPSGTSTPVFGGYPVAVAGKTGTAQVAGKSDFAWYVSYAPADQPKYVVAVMIEQGGHGGSAAAPAARMIYDALFDLQSGRPLGTSRSD